jgi:hypothetical protein
MDTTLTLVEVLQKLYASEINVSIESDWDGGFNVSIGNHRNGLKATENFDADQLHLAAAWLEQKALALYPNAAKE